MGVLDIDTHLDCVISAVRASLHQEDKKYIDNIRKNVKGKKLSPEKRDEVSKAITEYERQYMGYRIELHPKQDWDEGKGIVKIFDNGAQIGYSTKGSHLLIHVVICHEIGHIKFHVKRINGGKSPRRDFVQPPSENDEKEATAFAKEILLELADKIRSDIGNSELNINEKELDNAIKSIKWNYNY